jgi:hypothetical protein
MSHWNGITLAWRVVRSERPLEQKRECTRERNTRIGYVRRTPARIEQLLAKYPEQTQQRLSEHTLRQFAKGKADVRQLAVRFGVTIGDVLLSLRPFSKTIGLWSGDSLFLIPDDMQVAE